MSDPLPPVYPPTRTELAAAQRANLLETVKDRWNAEIESGARWVQEKDWEEVREGVETAVGRLWAKAFGEAGDEVEKGERKAGVLAGEAKDAAKSELAGAATKTQRVASEKAGGVAAAAKSAYADAKAKGSEVAGKGEQKAEAAKGSVLSAIGKGIEKGKEALGIAKATVVGAEQKVEAKLDATLSPVERTMRQRYEKPSGLKSVEETLAERYQPLDKRDNTVLRGL